MRNVVTITPCDQHVNLPFSNPIQDYQYDLAASQKIQNIVSNYKVPTLWAWSHWIPEIKSTVSILSSC